MIVKFQNILEKSSKINKKESFVKIIRITGASNFLTTMLKARRQWSNTFTILSEMLSILESRLFYSAKLSIKSKDR